MKLSTSSCTALASGAWIECFLSCIGIANFSHVRVRVCMYACRDVDELVSKFLQKNEKMDIGKNYLEALNEDAAKIQEEISRLEKEADERRKQLPAEDVEVPSIECTLCPQVQTPCLRGANLYSYRFWR